MVTACNICNWKQCISSSRLTAETQKDLPKKEKKKPWCEVVLSFTGTTAEESESLDNIQTDYGFKHDYESDTESIKFETCSFVTQFDLAHEDELDESSSLQIEGAEAEREKGRLEWSHLAGILWAHLNVSTNHRPVWVYGWFTTCSSVNTNWDKARNW